jgi:hypothetical protein
MDSLYSETMSDKVSARRSSAGRVVSAEVQVFCPFSVAEEYAVGYLSRPEAGQEGVEIRIPIRFLPTLVFRRRAVTFGLHRDTLEAGRTHDEICVRWTAGTPLLPEFRGTVRFRIAGSGARVLVEGSYRAPFGTLGRMLDYFVGRHLAQMIVRDFTRRIVSFLEARERDWRARIASPLGDPSLL